MTRITKERAERIAKAQPCAKCKEYSYERVKVKASTKDNEESLGVAWTAELTCGVCDTETELGIGPDGTIVYN